MEFLSMVHALLGDHLYNLGTIDDIKLKKAVDSLDGRKGLQRDPDKLDSWAITNHVEFNGSWTC